MDYLEHLIAEHSKKKKKKWYQKKLTPIPNQFPHL